jgi:uncharacterized membrane protein YfcA
VTSIDLVLVFLGGLAAGTINTVVGSGTLISFPVLLAVGYTPIVANVSNTIGLVPGSLAGSWGYRRELAGQWGRIARLTVVSVTGGIVGAVLLLVLPAAAFKAIVPAFIIVALVLVVCQPRISRMLGSRGLEGAGIGGIGSLLGLFVCGVYGGYFGAAQGILILATLGFLAFDSLQRRNAAKNVLAGATNLVAGAIFAFAAPVNWRAALVVASGAIIGGFAGAKIGRRLSPRVLRTAIALVGVAAIAKLLL